MHESTPPPTPFSLLLVIICALLLHKGHESIVASQQGLILKLDSDFFMEDVSIVRKR
jgi:hypothetical protein